MAETAITNRPVGSGIAAFLPTLSGIGQTARNVGYAMLPDWSGPRQAQADMEREVSGLMRQGNIAQAAGAGARGVLNLGAAQADAVLDPAVTALKSAVSVPLGFLGGLTGLGGSTPTAAPAAPAAAPAAPAAPAVAAAPAAPTPLQQFVQGAQGTLSIGQAANLLQALGGPPRPLGAQDMAGFAALDFLRNRAAAVDQLPANQQQQARQQWFQDIMGLANSRNFMSMPVPGAN